MLSKPTVFFLRSKMPTQTNLKGVILKGPKNVWLTLSAYTIFSTHIDFRVGGGRGPPPPPPSHFRDNASLTNLAPFFLVEIEPSITF